MTIDVIIPAYNAEKTLRRAVASALECPFARVILVDDGSTDGTAALCREWARDSRVTLHRQENLGVSAARNAGLDLSTAERVAFLDADDILLPGALEGLSRVNADAVQGRIVRRNRDVYRVVPAGRMSGAEALHRAMRDPTAHLLTHGWLFRRELLTERFDPALTLGEDGEWMLRTLPRAETVLFLDTPVYQYELRPGSALRGGETGVCEAYMRTLRAAAPALDVAGQPDAAGLYRLTHLLLMLTHGDFREAMRLRREPMFREAFRRARLKGNSARIWTLRCLKWHLTPLVYLAVRIRRRMNQH